MITVLFATRNSAEWIDLTLNSMCRLTPPPGGHRIIIVDNGSTDDTSCIIESFRDKLSFTLLHEPVPGKNRALNCGRPFIEGDLVVFTDDDVIVPPDWLIKWCEAGEAFPETGVFSGAIKPHWLKRPDPWVLEEIDPSMVFALTGASHIEGEIPPALVFGPNMMIRAPLVHKNAFDESVGPDGTQNYAMGSERELNTRLWQQGARCRFVPDVSVAHIIREKQVRREWMVQRYFRFGRGHGRDRRAKYRGRRIKGVPTYLIRIWSTDMLMWLFYSVAQRKRLAFRHRIRMAQAHGAIYDSYHSGDRID